MGKRLAAAFFSALLVLLVVAGACRGERDSDQDTILDSVDNCPLVYNFDQRDTDGDAVGDDCDPDEDGDTVLNTDDNCLRLANADQTNTDGDSGGDPCDGDDDADGISDFADNCPIVGSSDQADTDADGAGDACDADDDNDTVLDGADNCPSAANPTQTDTDGDGKADACDNCPTATNEDQMDGDADAAGDACDPLPRHWRALDDGEVEICAEGMSPEWVADVIVRHWRVPLVQGTESCQEKDWWDDVLRFSDWAGELLVDTDDLPPGTAEYEHLGRANMWGESDVLVDDCRITLSPSVAGTAEGELVLAHEFGHCLGFEHAAMGIMSEYVNYAAPPTEEELSIVTQEYHLR